MTFAHLREYTRHFDFDWTAYGVANSVLKNFDVFNYLPSSFSATDPHEGRERKKRVGGWEKTTLASSLKKPFLPASA